LCANNHSFRFEYLFVQLTPTLETAEDVAKRLGREMEQTVELLNRMTQKGQLYRYKQDETEMFATQPYLPGIFESVVIDRELAVAMDEYYDMAFDRTIYSANTPLFRTIPINKEFVPEWPISPYDDAMGLLRKSTDELYKPPKSGDEKYERIAQERRII